MAEQTQPTQPTKAKKGMKKGFFDVRTPITATRIQLYGSSLEELEGKIVKLDLTRSLKGKNFELRLKVAKKENVLEAEPISIELLGSYIRRMMRLGIDYVEDSYVAEMKDGKARIKPFMITRNKVSRAVRKELKDTGRKFVESYIKTRDSKEVFEDILTNKIQKELFLKLKKIYPLALCEIRIFELV
jgi:ribosomal protein S3AE